LPFIFVIFYAFNFFHSLSLPYLSFNSQPINSILLVTITFCCFSVKLPVYGLHFWLPIAHVEAPTFGSIILAGVLLKLGGVGLLRSLPLFRLLDCFCYLLSYFMLALVTVTLVCCFQSDMKRLIAYSSVRHIIVLPPLLIMRTSSSLSGVIIIMLIHGVASPLLFMLVGIIYSLFSTRQLVFVRGLLVTSPLVSFVCVLSFLFTLSAPPFPSFVAEMAFIFTAILTSYYFIPFVLVFCFLSLLYNLNWLRSVVFSPSPTTSSYRLRFSSFLPIIMSLFMSAYLLPILSFL
jgi:NADH:ubiquinone oxidoreductase subunit 4 (subunit M)